MILSIKRNGSKKIFALVFSILIMTCSISYTDWYLEQKSVTKSGENPETTSIQKIFMKDKMMRSQG